MLRGTVGADFMKRVCTRYDELTLNLFSIFRYFPDCTKYYLLFQFSHLSITNLCDCKPHVFDIFLCSSCWIYFTIWIVSNTVPQILGPGTNIFFGHRSINHHENILDNSPSSSKAWYILFVNAIVFKSYLF